MSISTQPYSTQYSPPMPVIQVVVSRAGRLQRTASLQAVIDTGSDGTLIPIGILEDIGARFVGSARLRGMLGVSRLVDVYLVQLRIGAIMLYAIRVAALPQGDEMILGRNALNQLIITLNGVAGVTEFSI